MPKKFGRFMVGDASANSGKAPGRPGRVMKLSLSGNALKTCSRQFLEKLLRSSHAATRPNLPGRGCAATTVRFPTLSTTGTTHERAARTCFSTANYQVLRRRIRARKVSWCARSFPGCRACPACLSSSRAPSPQSIATRCRTGRLAAELTRHQARLGFPAKACFRTRA